MRLNSQPEHTCPSCSACNTHVVKNILHEFAESLGAAVDAKDTHTRLHSEEVAAIAYVLSLGMGMSSATADIIHVAAHLHDVGKIGIPDTILKKPGPLGTDEWVIMRQHPAMGVEIVRPVRVLRETGVLEMILHHHERFDGHGYPDGLQGTDIPMGARIICVADTISAMMQKRPYRDASSYDEVCVEIVKQSGSQFDPQVVEAFRTEKFAIRQMITSSQSVDVPAASLLSQSIVLSPDGHEHGVREQFKTGTDNLGKP